LKNAIDVLSANPAIGLKRGIGLQTIAYLPFGLEKQRTAAFPSSECELPTQNDHRGFPKAARQPKPRLANWTAPKLPLANSPNRPRLCKNGEELSDWRF